MSIVDYILHRQVFVTVGMQLDLNVNKFHSDNLRYKYTPINHSKDPKIISLKTII